MYVVTYMLVAGDTVLATLATHLATALNSVTGFPAVGHRFWCRRNYHGLAE